MTDRDFCYWLEGHIDKIHSHWAKLEEKKRRKFVRAFDDQQGRDLYNRIESARRNRGGKYDKYTLFTEWLAGILEVWGHLDLDSRKVANDSMNRELSEVLKPAPDAPGFHIQNLQTFEPMTFTCGSIDTFDKFNDQHYTSPFIIDGHTK